MTSLEKRLCGVTGSEYSHNDALVKVDAFRTQAETAIVKLSKAGVSAEVLEKAREGISVGALVAGVAKGLSVDTLNEYDTLVFPKHYSNCYYDPLPGSDIENLIAHNISAAIARTFLKSDRPNGKNISSTPSTNYIKRGRAKLTGEEIVALHASGVTPAVLNKFHAFFSPLDITRFAQAGIIESLDLMEEQGYYEKLGSFNLSRSALGETGPYHRSLSAAQIVAYVQQGQFIGDSDQPLELPGESREVARESESNSSLEPIPSLPVRKSSILERISKIFGSSR